MIELIKIIPNKIVKSTTNILFAQEKCKKRRRIKKLKVKKEMEKL